MLGSILSSGLVTGYSTTTVRLQTTLPTVPVSGPVIPSLRTLRKHRAGKRYAIDADVKQAVTSWLDTLTLISYTNA